MKEISSRNKDALKVVLADMGYENVTIDKFGNIIKVRRRSWIERILSPNKSKESGEVIMTLGELGAKSMGLDYDPNVIVKNIISKWVNEIA